MKAPAAWLGDPVAIKDPTAAVFRQHGGANLLMIGQSEDAARALFVASALSLAAQLPGTQFTVLDGTPDDADEAEHLRKFAGKVPGASAPPRSGVPAALAELTAEIERRNKGESERTPRFLFLFGVHRFRELRKADDDFSFGRRGEREPSPAERLATVLKDGPLAGVHVIAWCDSLVNLNRAFDRPLLREFAMRVLFQMSATDSSTLMDSPAASKLGRHRALYLQEEQERPEKFRPYGLPPAEWLTAACDALRAGRVAGGTGRGVGSAFASARRQPAGACKATGGLTPRRSRVPQEARMPKPQSLRIAVIGAGPVGIEAALYAKACGFPVAVYDRGRIGDHMRRWGHVRMFTPFGMNVSQLGLAEVRREKAGRSLPAEGDHVTGRQFVDAYLTPLAESETLIESLHLEEAVLQVGRAASVRKSEPGAERLPFRLLVRDGKGQERIDTADVILDCTGKLNTPNRLGDGSIPAVGELAARQHIAWGIEDILGEKRAHYAGKSIVLVGDGYSAAATICVLAELAEAVNDTWVFWLTRGPRGAAPAAPQRCAQGARPARGARELARHPLRRQFGVPPTNGNRRSRLSRAGQGLPRRGADGRQAGFVGGGTRDRQRRLSRRHAHQRRASRGCAHRSTGDTRTQLLHYG